MTTLSLLIPIALGLGLLGLGAFPLEPEGRTV
jgi:nitrogen fixation-related uncharacterized protein